MALGEYIAAIGENPSFLMGGMFLETVRRSMEREVEEKAGHRNERGKPYSVEAATPAAL